MDLKIKLTKDQSELFRDMGSASHTEYHSFFCLCVLLEKERGDDSFTATLAKRLVPDGETKAPVDFKDTIWKF